MGNRLGEGSALNDLGAAQQETHHYAAAIETHTRALQLFRAIPSPLGEASALTDLGSAERKTKDYVSAAASLTQAVTIFRDIRNKFGEASALIEMGSLALEYKTLLSARDYFTQALKISDENGLRVQQARAHESIAACDLGDSRAEDAAGHLQRALNIYAEISSPRAQHVKKKLLEIAPDSSSGSV
jgi:tetratricopeptide (TPR) repeat protein